MATPPKFKGKTPQEYDREISQYWAERFRSVDDATLVTDVEATGPASKTGMEYARQRSEELHRYDDRGEGARKVLPVEAFQGLPEGTTPAATRAPAPSPEELEARKTEGGPQSTATCRTCGSVNAFDAELIGVANPRIAIAIHCPECSRGQARTITTHKLLTVRGVKVGEPLSIKRAGNLRRVMAVCQCGLTSVIELTPERAGVKHIAAPCVCVPRGENTQHAIRLV